MNRRKRLVGIMITNPKERRRTLQFFLRFGIPNAKLFCFTPSSINWRRKYVWGLHRINRTWRISRFPIPRVVYNRCYSASPDKRMAKVIGSVKCFNHVNQFNKREVHEILAQSELAGYVPETAHYDEESAVRLLEAHQAVYVKPHYGFRGAGIYRIERTESGDIHIGHNYLAPRVIVRSVPEFLQEIRKLMRSRPYIVQEGIPVQQWNQQIFDIRVLVQKNNAGLWSVTNLVSRIAYPGCYNTSISDKICVTEEVLRSIYDSHTVDAMIYSFHDISLKAAAILENRTNFHLGEISVDCALDQSGRIWIIEINGKPQKDIYKGMNNYLEVYKRPLEYASYLIEHSSE